MIFPYLPAYSLLGPAAAPIAEPNTEAPNAYGFIDDKPAAPVIAPDKAAPPIVPNPVATPAPIPLLNFEFPPNALIPCPI